MDEPTMNKDMNDVTLTYTGIQIPANKLKLVTGSEYFNSLFSKPFAESESATVDLSSTADDSTSLESIVRFLHTDEINITDDNITSLMKLSTFFQIPKLQELCIEFVLKTVGLQSCIRFYLTASKYQFVYLEKKLEATIKSRFHDALIYQDRTLQISAEELTQFFQKGFFKYCSVASILNFLINWTKRKGNQNYLALACDILNNTEINGNRVIKGESKKLLSKAVAAMHKLSEKLKQHNLAEEFISKFQSVAESAQQMNETNTRQDAKNSKQDMKRLEKSITQPDFENVIITFSPTDFIIQNTHCFDILPRLGFDVCVYAPKNREWYHVTKLDEDFLYKQIMRSDARKAWEYTCAQNKIYCTNPEYCESDDEEYAIDLDLKEFQPRTIYHMPPDLKGDARINATCLIPSLNEGVYAIYEIYSSCLSEANDTIFLVTFECYNLTLRKRCHALFKTPQFRHDSTCTQYCASVSNVSNEMILVYFCYDCGGLIHGYVTDMKAEHLHPKLIYSISYKPCVPKGRRDPPTIPVMEIIQGNDRFYIVEVSAEAQDGTRKVHCIYEYVYNSNVLTSPTGLNVPVPDVTTKDKEEDFRYGQLFYQLSKSENKSVWLFSGNQYNASSLSEVQVNEDGKLSVNVHTPPPFSSVTALFPARIRSKALIRKKVNMKYLTDKKTPACPHDHCHESFGNLYNQFV